MDGLAPQTCDECGFDASDWRVRDAVTLFDALADPWWRLATRDIPASALADRPAPGAWSALEYGLHTASMLSVARQQLEQILGTDGVEVSPPARAVDASAGAGPAVLDPTEVLVAISEEGRALAALARRAAEGAWDHHGRLPGSTVQARAVLLDTVHDASHHQMDVSRDLAAVGAGTPAGAGRIAQVSTSRGGVPKLAVPRAEVGRRGVAGDRQDDAKHHGRPFQALCVWSGEVIAGLAAEGHPIGPGAAGENVTVEGVDWATLRPGSMLRVGTALAELSFPAVPCKKQSRWFTDGDFSRLAHEVRPEGVRWYAWVREPGEVGVDDEVVVQPRL